MVEERKDADYNATAIFADTMFHLIGVEFWKYLQKKGLCTVKRSLICDHGLTMGEIKTILENPEATKDDFVKAWYSLQCGRKRHLNEIIAKNNDFYKTNNAPKADLQLPAFPLGRFAHGERFASFDYDYWRTPIMLMCDHENPFFVTAEKHLGRAFVVYEMTRQRIFWNYGLADTPAHKEREQKALAKIEAMKSTYSITLTLPTYTGSL